MSVFALKGLFGKVKSEGSATRLPTHDDDLHLPRQNNKPAFDRFSAFLPYVSFIPEYRLFILESDKPGVAEGLGFSLELQPQVGASEEMADYLTNLFMIPAPEGTGIQISLFGSPNFDGLLQRMRDIKLKPSQAQNEEQRKQYALFNSLGERRTQYYRYGARNDLFKDVNYRMRDVRLIISVVYPTTEINNEGELRAVSSLRQTISSVCAQYSFHPREWEPDDLINFCSLILNPQDTMRGVWPTLEANHEDDLRDQIIKRSTRIDERDNDLIFHDDEGAAMVRALSVRTYPSNGFTLAAMRHLLGSDTQSLIAYPGPYLITLGTSVQNYEKAKATTVIKAARAQQNADSEIGRYFPRLKEVNEDWKIAQQAFDEGKGTLKLYHQILVFSHPDDIRRNEEAARAIWRGEKFELTVDTKMHKQALMASLPMCYGPLLQQDLRITRRVSTKTVYNAANMSPMVAAWRGTSPRYGENFSRPVLTLFEKATGQIAGVDLFANQGNYNAAVVGTSGSGKSALLNEVTLNTLAQGGKVWIIDVGGSYKKLCQLLGGQYIEFSDDANISLNPFSMVTDIDEDMEMLKPILGQMMSPSGKLEDYQLAQLEITIRQVFAELGTNTTITNIAESLKTACFNGGINPLVTENTKLSYGNINSPARAMGDDASQEAVCDPRVRDLGVQLSPYAEDGAYGKWFSGPCNVEFPSNLVVLELEQLKAKPDLQGVVLSLIMYRITHEMYLGDRSQDKVVIIDEAWDLLKAGHSAQTIESGYRRARKYRGSFITATQSVADYYKNPAAQAAFENSDWLFLLRMKPESIQALRNTDKLMLDDYTHTLLSSLRTVNGQYSEIFVKGTEVPPTVFRLYFDPFVGLAASTQPGDFEAVKAYTDHGMSTQDAITQVLKDRNVDISHFNPENPLDKLRKDKEGAYGS